MSGKQADLKARIERLRRLAQVPEGKATSPQDALRLQMQAMLQNADPQEFLAGLRTVVAVEQLERIRSEIERQENSSGSQLHTFASVAARDGYRAGLRLLTSVGAMFDQAGRWPEPVVFFEPMATPMTLNRGGSLGLNFTGGKAASIPFPLVFIPDYPDSSIGSLCVIQHEIGHNLDADFGISTAIEPLLENRISDLPPNDVETWVAWLPELIADVFGLLLGGSALLLELAEWASVLGDNDALASSTHPYPTLRVQFAKEVLATLGVEVHPAVSARTQQIPRDATGEVGRLAQQVPAIANALMVSPIPRLKHAELRDLGTNVREDEERVLIAAEKLTTATLKKVPYRLLPSVGQYASVLKPARKNVFDKLVASAETYGSARVEFRAANFANETLINVTPPILAEENARLKKPPANLFANAREVSFVGAQNDGLPKLFEAHFEEERKRRIDIFYLSEPALARMAHAGQTAEQMIQGRRQSLRTLTPEFMDQVAESWRIFEYDEPYFFASYWDASAPGGRIHTSSQGWGQNIKVAPSIDYVWPQNATQPNRKYRWYLASLAGLLECALIRSSNEGKGKLKPFSV